LGTGYCLGEWTVRPHRNRIERGSDSVHLAPKAMAVLDCLARAANSVVTRQEIFDSVWPGADVSDDALTQRVAELRKVFGDSAHHSKIIETIPKVGFRLIPPVIPLVEESITNRKLHRATGPEPWLKWLVIVVAGLLAVALYFWSVNPTLQKSTDAAKPAIAVLPFVNMSEDPSNEYFSDGISEELLSLLAKVPGLHVISRSSSFSFKGERLKIADLARELNASLIVEGSVRKIDNRVRITAQLIDPNTDKHLWSNSYDRELSDIFLLQKEIAQSIVTAMHDEIGPHTVVGSRPTANIEAYELFLMGRQRFYQRGPALDSAIMVLKMAVDEDPEFADAWAYLAAAAAITWGYQTSISNEEARLIAEQASSRALKLDPGLGLALAAQALLAFGYEGNVERAFQLIDRAAEVDPHNTTIRLWAGMYYHYWGYLDESLSHFEYAVRYDPRVGIINGCLGLLYLAQGREDLAASHLAKATKLGWSNHFNAQASQLMMKGDFDAAFAILKVTFATSGAGSDPLPWIYELEEAGQSYIENPASAEVLMSVVKRAPERVAFAESYLTLLFNLKDPFFGYFSRSINESHLWPSLLMPIVWLPEYRAYVEDSRFLEIFGGDGALELWEQRGFPDGCTRVNDPISDRLDCSQRY
jgi:TolB-like protein/DNA-binding winged helix-turn-helix (wHTH) protein/Tfp pilus assembly protein PilF